MWLTINSFRCTCSIGGLPSMVFSSASTNCRNAFCNVSRRPWAARNVLRQRFAGFDPLVFGRPLDAKGNPLLQKLWAAKPACDAEHRLDRVDMAHDPFFADHAHDKPVQFVRRASAEIVVEN